ncbi:MAG: RDD family protein [bacterium]|nr:RDD family protein [bacterium]
MSKTKGDMMTAPMAMTGRVTLGSGEVRELASPGKRLVARIIDVAIIVAVAVFLAIAGIVTLGSSADDSAVALFAGLGGIAMFFVLFLVYEPTFIALKGQTLGKMAMRIMVVRADDGEVPGWGKAIGRWILPGLLSVIPVVGGLLVLIVYLSLLWDDRRQGWHDKMGTTVVINV